MQVRDVMERDMRVSHPGQSLVAAARPMLASDEALQPVVEEDDRLVVLAMAALAGRGARSGSALAAPGG